MTLKRGNQMAVLLAGTGLALSMPGTALAQGVPAEQSSSGLSEIVVTANKRSENLQDTPIAITALTAEDAEFRGVTEVKDISSLAPNVSVLPGTTNSSAAVVTIRGIPTSADETQGYDSPIGIYIDGVYIARSSAASVEVADIERIEVLRGPQGTLFGRNTTGGAVNFISREPDEEGGVRVRLGAGNYGLVNGKLTFDTGSFANDTLRMSFGAVMRKRQGTVDNLLERRDSRDPGASKLFGFRWATVADVSDAVTITNIFDYTKIKAVNAASQFAAAGNGVIRPNVTVDGGVFTPVQAANVGGFLAQSQTRILEAGCPKTPTLSRLDALCSEGALQGSDKIFGNLFRVEADVGGMIIRSSSSIRKWRNIQVGTDLDGLGTINGPALGPASTTLNGFPASTLTLLGQPAGTAAFLASQPVFSTNFSFFQTDNDRRQRQFSQEIELISDTDGPFQWVLGGFYFTERGRERNPQNFAFVVDTNAAVFNSTNFGAAAPLLQATNPARYRVALQRSTLDYTAKGTSFAVYGQGTWRPGGADGRLGVTLGLRYSWDKKSMERTQNGATPYTNPVELALNNRTAKFSAPTGNLTVDFRASDDINLYAKIARGYRSGGLNARQATNVAANLGLIPFDNEVIWSYEVGAKTEFGGMVRLNAAAFYNEYSDLQLAIPIPITGGGSFGTATANAGSVTYTGFELEGEFRPSDNFWFDGSVGYVKKDFKEYNTLDNNNRLTNIGSIFTAGYSPDWTANIAANVQLPLGDTEQLTGRLGYNYVSSFAMFGNPITAPFMNETMGDARGLVDGQLRIDGLGSGTFKNLSLTLWGKNLTNEKFVQRSVDFGALGYVYLVFGEPRTFGATLDVAF